MELEGGDSIQQVQKPHSASVELQREILSALFGFGSKIYFWFCLLCGVSTLTKLLW